MKSFCPLDVIVEPWYATHEFTAGELLLAALLIAGVLGLTLWLIYRLLKKKK